MKNLNRVVGALLALSLYATSSWALVSSNALHTDFTQLQFRAQVAANPVSQWDSLTTKRIGAQSCVLDTTVAISTEGWLAPQNTAAGDSTQFCALYVYDATGSDACESGADSLYIAVQVSVDGETWATPGTFVGGTAPTIGDKLPQTNVAGGFRGCLSLNGAALGKGQPVWIVRYFSKDLSTPQGLEDCNLQMWPYIRWIVGFPDAKGYMVQAKAGFFTIQD